MRLYQFASQAGAPAGAVNAVQPPPERARRYTARAPGRISCPPSSQIGHGGSSRLLIDDRSAPALVTVDLAIRLIFVWLEHQTLTSDPYHHGAAVT